jgi:predicted RNase H-like HicB family nuclease
MGCHGFVNRPSFSRSIAVTTGLLNTNAAVDLVDRTIMALVAPPIGLSPPRPSNSLRSQAVKSYTIVIEYCPETQLYVGYVPGFPGAHSQGETMEELRENIREVIAMLLEDGEPELESEFVGTQTIQVA